MAAGDVPGPTGPTYLHCDPPAGASLKMPLDAVFGQVPFRHEIVWHYHTWANTAFQRNHAVLLLYAKSPASTFHKLHGPPTKRQRELRRAGYNYNTGTSQGRRIVRLYDRENPWVKHKLASGEWADRDSYDVTGPVGPPFSDGWDISALNGQAKERLGSPTQKPLVVLEHLITASSNPGDIILDHFCGCATALVAAEHLNRQWSGLTCRR